MSTTSSLKGAPPPVHAMEQATHVDVVAHEGLGAAPATAQGKPHHILNADGSTGRFRNPHESFVDGLGPAGTLGPLGFFKVMGTFVKYRFQGKLDSPDTTPPTVTVRKPTFLSTRFPDNDPAKKHPLRATWLGHACYYIEFPTGLRVLFDPVFEDRCSPMSFLGPKRFTPAPCVLADLPAVDAVVISHSHYDHLSGPSVQTIRQHHPRAHFFVGLGLADWFRSAGIHQVTELDWWQDAEATVTLGPRGSSGGDSAPKTSTSTANTSSAAATAASPSTIPPLKALISCLPSQHTSARSPFDRDHTLWCSWAVSSGGRSVYFGGDTGYRTVDKDQEEIEAAVAEQGDGRVAAVHAADDAVRAQRPGCPDFAHIGQLRGPFDVGLIPIGAYKPRTLFSGMHADPLDAVDIFQDTRCRRAMGIHWGTWALTTEPVLEPPQKLKEALRRRGLPETGVFDVCEIGESREFD
ncbi:hypothetical protein SCUCBS95973_006563 [Sporothrix curviconia]|uniref:Metallo-beta-lactamase domain-containing protein n=1 Tax=Sporothrix curviconia TaxID=1260050 RepID=A0ABP0C7G8_9PEZI